MIATMIQIMMQYLMGETLYSKELQALAMALQGALAVRRGPNKDRTMHPFHAFALSTVIAFAGGWFGFFWMGKPTPMITNGDLNIIACMIAFTVVNYTPFDIGYKVVNLLPIKLVITSFGQLFRCLGMIRFITTAFNEVPASPYYSIPVLGPVLYGTLLGNWGGFFLKGFNGCLENGIPWPFQNGIVMGLFFHLFAHDVDGPLGNILRSAVYAIVPRQFEDDRTFALIITGIFMQVTGVLMLPQFLGPSFSVFLTPVTSLSKVYSKITPFPPPRDVDNTKPSSSTYTPPPITEKKAEDYGTETTISTRAGKRKNKRKNKKKTA